ncbi:hypothetical protein F0562_020657 [Nyssa sinensis]|uniref:PX domain-containing protein n=1 Tax=Nyssa sinensis TaxID=561372 RepID=A0A5J5BWC2_9ASTE|nr:hypothetical protein F0562_020657 [Nyssa sinensis]
MKAMETLQDLIDEAKVRTVWWALCIFAVSYFLTHTSKSMWMNIPISILLVSVLRILFNEVEFHWKVRRVHQQTYLSHLEKKQLAVNDSHLSPPPPPPPPKWKRKIESPLVEVAMEEFINKLLKDFVTDLWYSEITPDQEAPELIHAIIMDVLAEISGRVKDINLVDLLTRDVVNLVGDHLDLFRRNQAAIGVDITGTLSSEERDERLKHHLMASKELHPALISPECEYKVLQRLMGGVLAIVLRPRESQCPLVRCIARELVTCLVMQPVMNSACPGYINELIEYIFLAIKDYESKEVGDDQSSDVMGRNHDHSVGADSVGNGETTSRKNASCNNQEEDMMLSGTNNECETSMGASGNYSSNTFCEEPEQPLPADWARGLEAATQRRAEILMPENLENMWTKGRNYKKRVRKNATAGLQAPVAKCSGANNVVLEKDPGKEMSTHRPRISTLTEDKKLAQLSPGLLPVTPLSGGNHDAVHLSRDLNNEPSSEGGCHVDELEDSTSLAANGNKSRLKRSNSTCELKVQPNMEKASTSERGGPIILEFYGPDFGRHNEVHRVKGASDVVFRNEGLHVPKLSCRVLGAYFEKHESKSFAVYSIAVTDADKSTWFVKRRYRNFERLHRHLKDIPNYTLHLPPKRIFSSSTEDAFVHQRCIQLDKYLQDLLSIANVVEQHEVWDFFSVSSKVCFFMLFCFVVEDECSIITHTFFTNDHVLLMKSYSFGKSSSVMRTLAVNVDDAVDDIVRQFKGVSDGLMKVVGSSSSPYNAPSSIMGRNLSWNAGGINKHITWKNTLESAKSFSDNWEGDKDGTHVEVGSRAQTNGWHSDNELNSMGFSPRVVKRGVEFRSLDSGKRNGSVVESESISLGVYPAASFRVTSDQPEDPVGMPPEWTPPNLSVPVLNLVDKVFQLNRRGWLRRQVFWVSKQIMQLMMEDAIDDWLLRQIQWLRREDVIAQGIRWVQDVLWPGGIFFLKLTAPTEMNDCQHNLISLQSIGHSASAKVSKPGSFEQQLEAARRASDVKKMIFSGAPTALVSLIGHKQYRHCAEDIYCFLQSTICLKQLAYGILELILISIFPEMRDLLLDVHDKMCGQLV